MKPIKHNTNHTQLKTLALSLALVGLLAACNWPYTSGYGYKIVANPSQKSIQFECRYSTITNTCNLAVLATPTDNVVNHSMSAGQGKQIQNAPVGAQFCASDKAVEWQSCTRYTIGEGTTNVEVGTTVR